MKNLHKTDPAIAELIAAEKTRQDDTLMLIPSENYSSPSVREALGSVLTHKYSEGEPKKRYYEGNEIIDKIELLAVQRAKKLFDLDASWHVNVKGLSASIANFVVYNTVLQPGDLIMSMNLTHGGHISHGWMLYRDKKTNEIINPFDPETGKVDEKKIENAIKIPISMTSRFFKSYQYPVEPKTNTFDYDKIEKLAKKMKPKLMVSGGTAYPRELDYKKLSEIAHKVGALYMADVAHEAGLIAGKAVSSPFKYADIVTTSTQKTLRGPRGSIIFIKKKYATDLDKMICPGIQGGPFNNNIAAIATCLKEADTEDFVKYAKQIVINAQALAKELINYDFEVVTGGTDKHLILVDLRNRKLGKRGAFPIARKLAKAGLILNRNTVPYDTGSPFYPSGIRMGTPGCTTRGMKEKEMIQIAKWIHQVVDDKRDTKLVLEEVKNLTKKFPY